MNIAGKMKSTVGKSILIGAFIARSSAASWRRARVSAAWTLRIRPSEMPIWSAWMIERTNAGLAAARKRGTHLGRRFRLTPHQQKEARRMRVEEGKTYAQLAALFRVSRSVVWRAVNSTARGGA